MNMTRLNSKLLLCAAALAATSVAGCADGQSSASDSETEDLMLQAPASQATTPDKNGVYFADVKAIGTGCPADTVLTSISSDGLAFTISFAAFDVRVDANKSIDNKTCQLAIKLHSPGGLSYAVSEFYYSGYATLPEGTTLSQTATYYFQGTKLDPTKTNRTILPDPTKGKEFDDQFVFTDVVKTTDMVFSACGTDRLLNVRADMSLRNGTTKKEAVANLAAIDANTRLEFKFAVRPCGDGGVGIVVPDAGPIRSTGK